MSWLASLVRGLITLDLLLLIGVPVAAALVRLHGPRPGLPTRETMDGWFERLPGLLAWFLLVCSLMRGALQLLAFAEPGEPIAADLARAVLLEGSWGAAWLMQSLAAFLLLALSWLWRREPRRLTLAMILLLLVAVIAQSGMGHGAEESWGGVTGRAIHTAHLLGGGLWLGTLAILALVALPVLRGEDALPTLGTLLRAFSTPARLGVLLLLLSGVTASLHYSGGSPLDLPGTIWGRLLLAKSAAVLAAMALGAWNWRVGTPALTAGTAAAAPTLRRTIALELLLGAVILVLTAWMTGSPLPSHGE